MEERNKLDEMFSRQPEGLAYTKIALLKTEDGRNVFVNTAHIFCVMPQNGDETNSTTICPVAGEELIVLGEFRDVTEVLFRKGWGRK